MIGERLPGKKHPMLYKISSCRADWKSAHKREAALMVKGTNRHVIVVRSPDPQVFEEAIFVLREEYLRGRRADQAIDEARRAASEYLRRQGAPEKRRGKLRGVLLGLAVVLIAAAAWIAIQLLGA